MCIRDSPGTARLAPSPHLLGMSPALQMSPARLVKCPARSCPSPDLAVCRTRFGPRSVRCSCHSRGSRRCHHRRSATYRSPTLVALLGVAVCSCRRFGTRLLPGARLLRRARLGIALPGGLHPFLAFGLLALTRLGLSLCDRSVLDVLSVSVSVMTQPLSLIHISEPT